MFALVFCVVLATSPVDDFCQSQYGHPGDLGVTGAAEKYFTVGTTYAEIALTIGAKGKEIPSNDTNLQVYSWENGQLEMHLRDHRLSMYRMNGQWRVVSNPVASEPTQQIRAEQNSYDQSADRREYERFYEKVEKIVNDGSQVAASREKTDIRAVQFYLKRLRTAIDAGNWKQTAEIRDRMRQLPALQRSHVVAVDAKRRLAESQRADEERRHREEMRQRERIHQAEMRRQQAIINALDYLRNN